MCGQEGNGNHDFISWNLIMAFCVICDSACLSFSSALTGPLKHKRPKTLPFWCSKDMTGYDYALSGEKKAERKRDGMALINSNAGNENQGIRNSLFVWSSPCFYFVSAGLVGCYLYSETIRRLIAQLCYNSHLS